MTYKAVFFDIDGTLVNEEKEIPQDTIEAIAQLKESGIDVFIATGRAPYYFQHYAKPLGIDSFVSFNGSYVVYKGKVVHEHPIPEKTLELLESTALANNHPIVMQGAEAGYANYPTTRSIRSLPNRSMICVLRCPATEAATGRRRRCTKRCCIAKLTRNRCTRRPKLRSVT
ncbi:Haloacid dehalogenase domain protein hydrolase type 3 [Paenibacillus lactis 154]|uniref:Haloacid dehalogenase domain protein hydrolase type 3 n=1 Tax=Paenibacillus lactis 154 TaxID=743719 RepID=G4HKV3_9BACL|nr:Haloacid dehalogenase domain protein hydrolase type 3 [Paenibacillus lactis 154]